MLFLSVDSKVTGPIQPKELAQAAGLFLLSYFLAAIIYNPATFRELLKCLLPSREMEVLHTDSKEDQALETKISLKSVLVTS